MTTFAASVTIVDLPAGSTVTGAELLEAVQTTSGVGDSVQLTVNQLYASIPFATGVTVDGGLATTGSATAILVKLATSVSLTGSLGGANGLAAVAGGTTVGLTLSNATFGLFFGSGAPTITAGTSSLYLRSDAANATTRIYINTNGANTWTSFTTTL